MPSVVALLEQRERGARLRVHELREEADRIQAELAVTEQEWQEWVVARRRVDTVPAPDGGGTAGTEITLRCAGCGCALDAPGCGEADFTRAMWVED